MILRELFVKLGLSIDEASFTKGQIAANLITSALHKVVEVGAELVSGFIENTRHVIEYGDEVIKTSQKIGIATDALQELHYAGSLADLSAEEMSQSIGILSRNMQQAKEGSEEVAKAFRGIAFQEGGELKRVDEVLGNIADRFAAMPDGAEKTALAMHLFGRSGKQMIPLLNKGSAALAEVRNEARELGLVMSREDAGAAEELNDNLEKMRSVSKGLWREALGPLLKIFNRLAMGALKWWRANRPWVKEKLEWVIGKVSGAFHFLAKNIGLVTGPITYFAKGVGNIVGWVWEFIDSSATLRYTLVGLGGALALFSSPFLAIGAVLAGLFLLFDDLRVYARGGKSMFGYFEKAIGEWSKSKSDDPWWLVAIKSFVGYLREAILSLEELGDALGITDHTKKRIQEQDERAGLNRGQLQAQTDRLTIEAARTRARAGLPLTDSMKAALWRQGGVTEEGFFSKYQSPTVTPMVDVPEVRIAPQMSSQPPAPNMSLNVSIGNVTQQPGESGEWFARRVSDLVNDKMQTMLQTAGAGVKR
ncbi:MAG: hypothetical protein A3E78_13925 [Alphaproteobacteria bacterium RIFCSPHIGHO2_12_FULL_63_12]|nr:MAG: hypothetical protein A3E78_13925 [Alphaproteobacteria bacterium RIFCSPHIGHO2_12_FULL_63_12]